MKTNQIMSRPMGQFSVLQRTKEFISALITEENLNTPKLVYLKNRGKKGGTWMHPILFIYFATKDTNII